MCSIYPLIPKIVPDFIYTVETANNETLEIQLVGNAKIERHVERIVMRYKRPRCGSAVHRLKHRRLHFEETKSVEERSHGRDHFRSSDEERPHFRMHGEIRVSLAVSLLGIAESGMTNDFSFDFFFFSERKRSKRFREQIERCDPNRHFEGFRSEQTPANADDITEVELTE